MQLLDVLKTILLDGATGTQEEISSMLKDKGLVVTQSTVSRALRKLGAVRTTSSNGSPMYYLPEAMLHTQTASPVRDMQFNSLSDSGDTSVRDLLLDIHTNGSLIVLHTVPGSASLIAHLLDAQKPANILGTIAGDDTIFVAPASADSINTAISSIKTLLSSA